MKTSREAITKLDDLLLEGEAECDGDDALEDWSNRLNEYVDAHISDILVDLRTLMACEWELSDLRKKTRAEIELSRQLYEDEQRKRQSIETERDQLRDALNRIAEFLIERGIVFASNSQAVANDSCRRTDTDLETKEGNPPSL